MRRYTTAELDAMPVGTVLIGKLKSTPGDVMLCKWAKNEWAGFTRRNSRCEFSDGSNDSDKSASEFYFTHIATPQPVGDGDGQ